MDTLQHTPLEPMAISTAERKRALFTRLGARVAELRKSKAPTAAPAAALFHAVFDFPAASITA